MPLLAGSRLGPYEIVAPLGAGGMGEVYRAKDPRLGRDVAIKVLPASFSTDADRLRRFEQEARAAGLLNHPNIMAVYDIGSHDGAPYVVSELLEGETLRAELAGGPPLAAQGDRLRDPARARAGRRAREGDRPPGPEAREPVRHEGRAAQDPGLRSREAHARGGGKLGRRRRTFRPDAPAPSRASSSGRWATWRRSRCAGRPADARSDIFAFGAILYEMLSGKRAFQGDSAADTMSAILREDPPDLSVTNQNVSPGLERILRHCLEKNPEQRFQSARDLAFDLEALSALSGAPTRSHRDPPGPTESIGSWRGRRSWRSPRRRLLPTSPGGGRAAGRSAAPGRTRNCRLRSRRSSTPASLRTARRSSTARPPREIRPRSSRCGPTFPGASPSASPACNCFPFPPAASSRC